jgi:hypothetical protein
MGARRVTNPTLQEREIHMSHKVDDFTPVMDLSSFRRLTRNDGDLMLELIDMFQTGYPPQLNRVWEAVRDGDALELRSAAQVLKTTIGIFSAPPAMRAVVALEEMGIFGDLSRSIEAFDILEFELEQLNIALMSIDLSEEQ